MRQMYYCPNCRALVPCRARFCGSCGISLKWAVQQVTPSPSPSLHGQQYNRQPGGQEPPVRNLPISGNQESASGNLKQFQQQRMKGNCGVVSPARSSSQDTSVTPISVEISKLLADFFSRH